MSNISDWFNNKNGDKTRFTFFHKVRQRDNIPLALPTLKIINTLIIIRVDHIKFLGVLFDEHLTWENHINLIEKSLGILNGAKI